jgi:hypothetical protein
MRSAHWISLPLLVLFAGFLDPGAAQESGGLPGDSARTAPVCLFPPVDASGVHTRPTLVWTPLSGVSRYVVECAADSLYMDVIARDTVDDEPITRLRARLPYARTIYWRATVWDSLTVPSWGASSRFTTAAASWARGAICSPTRRNEDRKVCVWLHIPVRSSVLIESVRGGNSSLHVESSFPRLTSGVDSIPVLLRFQPARFGVFLDTLVVQTDHGDVLIPFAGSSPAPILRAGVGAVDLGHVVATDTASTRIRLRNDTETNDAVVKRIRTRTQFFSVVTGRVRPVAPGESTGVLVRFHPKPARGELFGRFADTLLVEFDGGVERVLLQGESPPPRPVPDRRSIDFGEVAAQDTGVAILRIANGSINVLRLDSVRTRLKAFVPLQGRAVIGRRDTAALAVRFSPGWHGFYRDTLVMYNNSWRGPLRIPLSAAVPFPEPATDIERLDFGPVPQGDTSGVVIRIGNSSPSYLRIDSVRTRYRLFVLAVPVLPAVVMRGDSLRVKILFRPDSLRVFSDTLVIVTNGHDRVLKIPLTGSGSVASGGPGSGGVGGSFELYQNFPNPFNASTTFRYVLPVPSRVRLEVFTTIGQSVGLLVDGVKDAGYHDYSWRVDLPSGMYYCRLTAAPIADPGKTFVATRKVILVR